MDNQSTPKVGRKQPPPTSPSTSVLGVVDPNKRKSLDKAAFSSAEMHQFINELEGAHRSNRFVTKDTVLSLVAEAARNLIAIDMVTQGLTLPNARDAWQGWQAERLIQSLRRLYPLPTIPRKMGGGGESGRQY